jgi:anti-sigma regulatory factor (Ser/Thr protein kinase)
MELTARGLAVADRSGIGSVRRAAVAAARGLSLDEETTGRAAIVAVELATNVLKHGGGGWCFVSPSEPWGTPAVSVVAMDEGSGIADPRAAFQDGYSTTDTPGTGLGAVRRLSLSFDLYSRPGRGLVVAARVGAPEAAGASRGYPAEPSGERTGDGATDLGGVVRAKLGQEVSGDAWAARRTGGTVLALMADGLGHGPEANQAAEAAVAALRGSRRRSAGGVAEEVHAALEGTRGAAIAVAALDVGRERIGYAGIGNIAGRVVDPARTRNLVSVNGTAGIRARSLREFEYAAPPGSLVVLHSDGVSTRWSLEGYPGLRERAPEVIAAVLLRDFGRDRDDAAVLVMRARGRSVGGGTARGESAPESIVPEGGAS